MIVEKISSLQNPRVKQLVKLRDRRPRDEAGVFLVEGYRQIRRALDQLGFAFFFAPAWHPAFKAIAPTRQALAARGQRTIFNILGPLINPGRPAHTLLGVATAPLVEKMAAALQAVGTEAGLVVHGVLAADRGIDELTTATRNRVRGAGRLRELDAEWGAEDFGLTPAPFAELQGGDLAANLALTTALLAGRGPAGLVDTIVLNAATGLWICGRVASVRAGLDPARELLLGGAVARKIAATREFYLSGTASISAPTASGVRMAARSSTRVLPRGWVMPPPPPWRGRAGCSSAATRAARVPRSRPRWRAACARAGSSRCRWASRPPRPWRAPCGPPGPCSGW